MRDRLEGNSFRDELQQTETTRVSGWEIKHWFVSLIESVGKNRTQGSVDELCSEEIRRLVV